MDRYEKYRELGRVTTEIFHQEDAYAQLRNEAQLRQLRRSAADLDMSLASDERDPRKRSILLGNAAYQMEKLGEAEKAKELQAKADQEMRAYMASRTIKDKARDLGSRLLRRLSS